MAKWDVEKLRCETADWLERNQTPKGYADLRRVLDLALKQAAEGKGRERHATGQPFAEQPMLEIGRMVGVGFCLGQAIKKAQEASRMQPDAAQRELLGAINYLAGAYLLLEESGPN